MWNDSKEMIIYNSPTYINTHIILSCSDFKTIYPLMIDIAESSNQKRMPWREIGGFFTLLNDVNPSF